jgi:4-aminobutyrate aminotransferase-like enzyme
MDEIQSNDLPGNCRVQGQRLRAGLEAIQRKHPDIIGDVRGMGLMQALELVSDETAGDRRPNVAAKNALFEETKKRRLLIGAGGLYGNVIRISPMLNSSADEIDEALSILDESFDAIRR